MVKHTKSIKNNIKLLVLEECGLEHKIQISADNSCSYSQGKKGNIGRMTVWLLIA